MTEWLPVNMHPIITNSSQSTFRFKCAVKKGFKYRYWFLCNGIKTLDQIKEVSKRGDNELSNVIWVEDYSVDETLVDYMSKLSLKRSPQTYTDALVPPELQPKFEQLNEFVEQKIIVKKMIDHQSLAAELKEYE